jgi:hypothetical protein
MDCESSDVSLTDGSGLGPGASEDLSTTPGQKISEDIEISEHCRALARTSHHGA